jgi:hypothetical protein
MKPSSCERPLGRLQIILSDRIENQPYHKPAQRQELSGLDEHEVARLDGIALDGGVLSLSKWHVLHEHAHLLPVVLLHGAVLRDAQRPQLDKGHRKEALVVRLGSLEAVVPVVGRLIQHRQTISSIHRQLVRARSRAEVIHGHGADRPKLLDRGGSQGAVANAGGDKNDSFGRRGRAELERHALFLLLAVRVHDLDARALRLLRELPHLREQHFAPLLRVTLLVQIHQALREDEQLTLQRRVRVALFLALFRKAQTRPRPHCVQVGVVQELAFLRQAVARGIGFAHRMLHHRKMRINSNVLQKR